MFHGETSLSEPIVETSPATNVAEFSATINGNITNIGNPPVTERGFEYSTDASFATGTNVPVTGTIAPGNFSANLTDLEQETTYYYKA